MTSGIRYARSKSTRIAYQVLGSGKKNLILINGWVSNLEEGWLLPGVPEWLAELGSISRLILSRHPPVPGSQLPIGLYAR
jgi:hypothetical protein